MNLSLTTRSDSVVVSTSDSQARGPRFDPPLRQGNSFKFHFNFVIKCRETQGPVWEVGKLAYLRQTRRLVCIKLP